MVRHVLFKHDGEAVQCGFPVLNGPQSRSAVFPRGCRVNAVQVRGNLLAKFPAHEIQAVAHTVSKNPSSMPAALLCAQSSSLKIHYHATWQSPFHVIVNSVSVAPSIYSRCSEVRIVAAIQLPAAVVGGLSVRAREAPRGGFAA